MSGGEGGGTARDDARPAHAYDVTASRPRFDGRIISVRTDTVAMPGGGTSDRDVVAHPGAVGVVALRGEAGAEEVLVLRQYRHPVARHLVELPAGILDVDGEAGVDAAARELAEEAGLAADTWHVLVDSLSSPGMTDEAIRVFLARDVREVEQPEPEHEEAEMTTSWRPLSDLVDDVLTGEVENAMAVIGLLAAAEARRRGFSGLRDPRSAWPARPGAGGG